MPSHPVVRVNLLRVVQLLEGLLTSALCAEVFVSRRGTERERVWTLHRLFEFWTAVILRAPTSLTLALAEAAGRQPASDVEPPSRQGFFSRCKALRFEFFRDVFEQLTARLVEGRKPRFAREHASVLGRFPGVWVVDGSLLDAVAHRLKIVWRNRSVLLPGGILAFYDLGLGLVRQLEFHPDATTSELRGAQAALAKVPKGTLVMGDRLYSTATFFAALAANGLYGLTRYARSLGLHGLRLLSERAFEGGLLTDKIVRAGSGQSVPPQELRYILWQKGRLKRELLTNVLDPARLSAEEALGLYPARWSVERLFFDLKEVLNLNCFYAANTNAVAMQVYAAAAVYNAMRVAQAEVADQAGLAPEALSTPKLFPRVAAASIGAVQVHLALQQVVELNPHVRLRLPDLEDMAFATAALHDLLVHPRKGPRRARRYCKARSKWKPLVKRRRAPS